MSPADYGRQLAALEPPITEDQAEAAARILITAGLENAA